VLFHPWDCFGAVENKSLSIFFIKGRKGKQKHEKHELHRAAENLSWFHRFKSLIVGNMISTSYHIVISSQVIIFHQGKINSINKNRGVSLEPPN